jgi:hypothetical protein
LLLVVEVAVVQYLQGCNDVTNLTQ